MEQNKLKKRFGLFTAIAMFVGIVIGSGAFFKAQDVLSYTSGNMWQGILAWVLSGIVMIFTSTTLGTLATKYEKSSGIVDYAEATCGKTYAYYVGWFMAVIYCPTMSSFLAIASSRFICSLVGYSMNGAETMAIAGLLLVIAVILNYLSPKLAGIFQVSTTIIKLIPLVIMGVVGTIFGLVKGITIENFSTTISTLSSPSLFKAVVATSFAYEGWIVATSINGELKNSKKNLPKAMLLGSIIVIFVYILYFLGLSGSTSTQNIVQYGTLSAFNSLFGSVAGTILNVFALMCCLGSLNGLTAGCVRALYSLSIRDMGPNPQLFKQVDKKTNMPASSCFFGLLFAFLWLVYYYFAKLTPNSFLGVFSFDSSDLPVVTIYAMYIPIFVVWMKNEKKRGVFSRFILPICAIISSLFMVFCAFMGHGVFEYLNAKEEGYFAFPVLFYLIIFAILMFLGFIFEKTNKKRQKSLKKK